MGAPPTQQVHHLLVVGRVQGVGFRWFTRERARRRGLSGWVQNRPDGSVEVLVSGIGPVLADFLSELARGPTGAVVEAVQMLVAPDILQSDEPLPYPFQIVKPPLP